MAPPTKRRRLCHADHTECTYDEDYDLQEEWTHSHHMTAEVERYFPARPPPRPQRVDEVHLVIQERSVQENDAEVGDLVQARDHVERDIVSDLDVSQASVAAVTSLVNNATAVLSITSDLSTNILTQPTSLSQGSSTAGPPLSFSNASTTTPSSSVPSSIFTSNSTIATQTRQNSTASLFVASLSDGGSTTLPESSAPYTTTLLNGEVFTVPANLDATATDAADPTAATTATSTNPDGSPVTVTSYVVPPGETASRTSSGSSSGSTDPIVANSNDTSTPPAATIAGGVVGGAAGVAVFLLIVMLFVRWYRRRPQSGRIALPNPSFFTSSPDPDISTPRGPGMAERAGLRPLAAAVPSLFRHSNRSNTNTATTTTAAESSIITAPSSTERGFTRVSGRKLPSAFSPGMSDSFYRQSPPPPPRFATTAPNTVADPQRQPSDASSRDFQSDNPFSDHDIDNRGFVGTGTYDGADRHEQVNFSRGPQRRPTFHGPGPYAPVPRHEAGDGFGTEGLSVPDAGGRVVSYEAERGCRFVEEGL